MAFKSKNVKLNLKVTGRMILKIDIKLKWRQRNFIMSFISKKHKLNWKGKITKENYNHDECIFVENT